MIASDQRQDQQRLAVRLEPPRLQHVAAPVRVGERREHGDLDGVLERREESAGHARKDERLVVADDDQLQLAREQRS